MLTLQSFDLVSVQDLSLLKKLYASIKYIRVTIIKSAILIEITKDGLFYK